MVLGEDGVEPSADQAAERNLLFVGDRSQLVPNLRVDVNGDHHAGRTVLVGLDRPPFASPRGACQGLLKIGARVMLRKATVSRAVVFASGLYFLALMPGAGDGGSERMRHPVMPAACIFAGVGIYSRRWRDSHAEATGNREGRSALPAREVRA